MKIQNSNLKMKNNNIKLKNTSLCRQSRQRKRKDKPYMSFSKKILLFNIISLLFIAVSLNADAEVIFSENFDGIADGWNCTNPLPPGWTSSSACACEEFEGITHCGHEITSGGITGNSFKAWRHGSGWKGLFSVLNYKFSNNYREIYTRWYMKIPSDFSTNGFMNYLKLWRMRFGTSSGNSGEVYFNFNGSSFATANFEIGNSVCPPVWHVVLPSAEIPRDDNWHSWEVRVRLGTTGNSDSIIQMWLDGVLKYSNTAVNLCVNTEHYFTSTEVGIGNTGADSFQAAWRAIEFDDYVLSTTYVGPIAGYDTTLPSVPTNLSATAISSSQINLSWTASTDNVGVSGYQIYRCQGSGCNPTTQIATSVNNSYSDTGLTPSTTYVYSVAAYDAAGNTSELSATATATTLPPPDTTPPAAPRNVTIL